MLRRDFAVGVHVIKIGSVFGDDHLKWPPAPRGWKIQHLGQEYRRGLAVVSRQDCVIEMDGHVASPESRRTFSRRLQGGTLETIFESATNKLTQDYVTPFLMHYAAFLSANMTVPPCCHGAVMVLSWCCQACFVRA